MTTQKRFVPGKEGKVLHTSFEVLSTFTGSDDAILEQVRHVREAIRNWIVRTFQLKPA